MKFLKVILFIGLVIFLCQSFFPIKNVKESTSELIRKDLSHEVDSFVLYINDTVIPLAKEARIDSSKLQLAFLHTRKLYKKMEWATEYFMYSTARLVNGIPVSEAEVASNMILAPAGLQVLETYLFPSVDYSQKDKILFELENLLKQATIFKRFFDNIDIADWQIMDACKLEMFRIETLGITGFDDALTLDCIQESGVAINSLQKIFSYYSLNNENAKKTIQLLKKGSDYLCAHTDFNSFDRAKFIRSYANPITIAISDYITTQNLFQVKYNRLLNQSAKTLFDSNAFNKYAFSPTMEIQNEEAKSILGKRLFFETALSGNNTRSCASCHQPELAFTDGTPKHLNMENNGLIDRNAPSLINSALQPFQFYDFRSNTLEDQISNVVRNPTEMHGSIFKALNKIRLDKDYADLFEKAFSEDKNSEIDTNKVIVALATYERSLVRFNSRFDQYMRGVDAAMNRSEINGFNLFMGKAQCATCHYMPLFNGVVPPKFINMDAEVIGVPQHSDNKEIDSDLGLYEYLKINLYPKNQIEEFKYAFKTTTVRNVENTAPYMHNGVYRSLDEVIDFYNKGGGKGLGFHLDNQTLSDKPLNLTTEEIADMIAFIKSLSIK